MPIDARRALPCWDEPLLKATFSVTLVSRKGTVNLSNMPARSNVAVIDALAVRCCRERSDIKKLNACAAN